MQESFFFVGTQPLSDSFENLVGFVVQSCLALLVVGAPCRGEDQQGASAIMVSTRRAVHIAACKNVDPFAVPPESQG
jgi:hypothetical protein